MTERNTLEVDVYRVLTDCVEVGVEFGLNRAYKHSDNPDRNAIQVAVYDEVMAAISEKFWFPERPLGG